MVSDKDAGKDKDMTENTTRYALVNTTDSERIAPYLPSNYRVEGEVEGGTLISGTDSAGWTMDDYVLPRLGSGLHFGHEIGADEAKALLPETTDRDEDGAWSDAYHISYIGASNPTGVRRTWSLRAARLGDDHHAVRAIKGHLDFLEGRGIGPEFDDLDAVKANARRLGIEDEAGNYVPVSERQRCCDECEGTE
jgi:hypothetical protein